MATVKRTEVRLVAGILEEEAEDTGELATKIIQALDEKREKDDTLWAVVTHWEGVTVMYGPTKTKGQAEKILKNLFAPGPGMTAAVRQLRATP